MKRPKAFTLIELLVVIGIIAPLILVPTLGKVRSKAKLVMCSSNLRSITRLYKGYERPKDEFQEDDNILADDVLGAGKAMICPETTIRPPYGFGDVFTAWKFLKTTTQNVGMTQNTEDVWIDCSYSGNSWVLQYMDTLTMQKDVQQGFMSPKRTSWYWCERTRIFDDAAVPIFFDGIIGAAQPLGSDVIPPQDGVVEGAGSPEYQMASLAFRRHGSVTNVAFWDGHVATVKLPDLWTFRWTKNWKPRGPYSVPAS